MVLTDLHPDALRPGRTRHPQEEGEHISDQAQRAKFGQIEDASRTAEYHDVLQLQEADIAAGHRILRYSGLIAVSAPTVEVLDAAVAAIE